jgi:hypothetical protein
MTSRLDISYTRFLIAAAASIGPEAGARFGENRNKEALPMYNGLMLLLPHIYSYIMLGGHTYTLCDGSFFY